MSGFSQEWLDKNRHRVVGDTSEPLPPVRNAERVMAEVLENHPAPDAFQLACSEAGLPMPRKEWEFHYVRNWRSDYAWPDPEHMVAMEVDGGAWVNGRHNRAKGFLADMEKGNALACEGYRLIRCVPDDLLKPETLDLVRLALLG